MHTYDAMSRRKFFTNLGKGTLAVAVIGLTTVACSSDGAEPVTPSTSVTPPTAEPDTSTVPSSTSSSTVPSTAGQPAPTSSSGAPPANADGPVTWERANLGFVSAYVLARAGEAVIIDTGVAGSEGAIGDSLGVLDLGWEDVSHVILTHRHNDHQGSLPAVLGLATEAAAYAGAADIPAIVSPREAIAVGDGDVVFGLNIIETPGHTPGHIAILDPVGGLLVAGDSMNGSNGGVIGANPQFSPDMPAANESVKKLAKLTFETLVFGHGEPIEVGASSLVVALAATL
jgi:glyoxylase-like metal-dependent hydrolase (beta-lactamase superfamily II)